MAPNKVNKNGINFILWPKLGSIAGTIKIQFNKQPLTTPPKANIHIGKVLSKVFSLIY